MADMGNEENMAKVREAMELHQKAQLAGEFKEGIRIDYESMEGNHYTGVLVFKKPNMFDYMKMGARKSEILRQAGVVELSLVDNTIKLMAHIISTLEITLVKRPEWLLKPTEIKESDVLYHVYGRYQEWEETFLKPVPAEPTADSKAPEGAKAVDTTEVPVRGSAADGPEDSGTDGRTD